MNSAVLDDIEEVREGVYSCERDICNHREKVSFESTEVSVLFCHLLVVRTLPEYSASLSLNLIVSKTGGLTHCL